MARHILQVRCGELVRGTRTDQILLDLEDVLDSIKHNPEEFKHWLVMCLPALIKNRNKNDS